MENLPLVISCSVGGLIFVIWHRQLGEFLPAFFRDDRHSGYAYLASGIFLLGLSIFYLVDGALN